MRFLVKTFLFLTVFSILVFTYITVRDMKNSYNYELNVKVLEMDKTVEELIKIAINSDNSESDDNTSGDNMKYILQWTSPKDVPFVYMGEGQTGFIEKNCSYTNCFVTGNREYLGDYTKFDVIAFSGSQVIRMSPSRLPNRRSPHQKYAFASIESAANYPVCSNKFNGFFNWTWTYRLDSEAKWGYVVVRDSENKIIGPKTQMNWIDFKDMEPTSDDVRKRIKKKSKAAAWFVSNCYSKSEREKFVKTLQKELEKYDLKVDVYGKCGPLSCPRYNDECNVMIEKDYYFYLSFENSFAEDYVTEKLVYPLKNLAVPIVYGGANYTRFMPDGIYLNARELGAEKLAQKMNELIKNPEEYAEYFRWRNHYSYYRRVESIETDDYCRFCSILNEEETVKKTTIYQNFREWWDPPGSC